MSGDIGLSYQSQIMDVDKCEAVSGMIGMGNRSIRRKSAQMTLRLPQIPPDVIRGGTQEAALGS
jgi:hypothetical protein